MQYKLCPRCQFKVKANSQICHICGFLVERSTRGPDSELPELASPRSEVIHYNLVEPSASGERHDAIRGQEF